MTLRGVVHWRYGGIMSHFVDFTFEDGTSALVEISPVVGAAPGAPGDGQWEDDSPVGPVGAGSRVVQRSGQLLLDAFAPLAPILSGIHDQARNMGNAPDELSVEFGVKLTAGLKVAVVSGGEASFTVTATWNTSRVQRQNQDLADTSQSATPAGSAGPSVS
ncbi:CU044_2847 family protein [Streptomyces olivaceus]|uniref:CU044_2847 family protein n=1 Tax=Streptomyces olivaceus TaxID=47716 RepID=UPI003639379A